MLHGFEEARCECFSGREPLAAALSPFDDELGEFEADRGSFEEPLREGPAGRNPRAERLSSHRDDASLPREVLPTFSSRLAESGVVFVVNVPEPGICPHCGMRQEDAA
jgi:hypothetical protein